MDWWKSKMFVFAFFGLCTTYAQVPRDTSYTVEGTVAKIAKAYPHHDIKGVTRQKPGSVQVRKDVVYKQVGQRLLLSNLFVPKEKNVKGAILLIHGGGWRSGSPGLMTALAEQLTLAGYVVMAPEYRMSLEAVYPAAVNDLKDALSWLQDYVVSAGLDTENLVVMGCSAGGQLAALIGVTVPVSAIVDIDGVLAFKHPVSQEGGMAAQWLGGTYEQAPETWREASALTYVSADTPPTLFLGSKHPRFLAGIDEYTDILKGAGTYTEVQILQDAPHSFWLVTLWFEPTIGYILNFLNHVLTNTR